MRNTQLLQKLITYLTFSLYLLFGACTKPENELSHQEVLCKHNWYLDEFKIKEYSSRNVLLSDTVYNTQNCEKLSVIRFPDEKNCSKYVVCNFIDPQEKKGEWSITKDSILSANIYVQSASYGSGFIHKNIGIEPGKLVEINDTYFRVKYIENWYLTNGGGTDSVQRQTINTYRRK